jgi:hemerythrin-like domain-containing protein
MREVLPMAIGIRIGAPAEAGWEDPIGMLTDCHRRVEHFLGILVRLARRTGAALTEEESRALEAALHYFHTSGRTHNADEEESLFPRLTARLEEGSATAGRMRQLTGEHRRAEGLHATLERLLLERRARELTGAEQAELEQAAGELESLYHAHIRAEEEEVFPAARRLLEAEAVAAVGAELKTRRGLG